MNTEELNPGTIVTLNELPDATRFIVLESEGNNRKIQEFTTDNTPTWIDKCYLIPTACQPYL